MYELLSNAPRRLRWLQLTRTEFELRAGEQKFGNLQFQGSRAVGNAADGAWTFQAVSFLHRRIRIRDAATQTDIGLMALKGSQAGVLLAPTKHMRLSDLIWSQRERSWCSADDWLIQFQPGGQNSADLFKFQYDVDLDQSVRHLPELSLLILLGFYALARTK